MCDLMILSSLEKVLPGRDLPAQPLTGFSMLKNERSSFQAVYHGEEELEAEVKVWSPLSAFIRIYAVELIPAAVTARPASDDYYLTKQSGLFPDLLRPVKGKMKLAGTGSLWVELHGELPAGTYPVTVALERDGERLAEATVRVEVIDRQLPAQQLIYTNWFHTDCLADWYQVPVFSEDYWRITENYLRRAGDYGMNMVLTPVFTPPLDTAVGGERPTVQLVDVTVTAPGQYAFGYSNFDRWAELCHRCGMQYFEISHFFTQWGAAHAPKIVAQTPQGKRRIFGWETDAFGPEYRAFLRQFAADFIAHVEALGIRARCVLHVSDEPEKEHLEAYKAASAIVHELFPGFKIIDALSDFPFYQKKLVDTPIPANDHIEPFIGHVPELWTYYCCVQGDHYVSNRFFAMPSQRNRVLGFQLYKFRATGFLHWAFNFWFAQYSVRAIDPFTETDAGGGFPAGDSFVVYPGEDGKPLDSLRLHVFYDGLQDLRALQLLESLVGREKALAILEQEGGITFRDYPRSAAWHLETRERINRAIQANR